MTAETITAEQIKKAKIRRTVDEARMEAERLRFDLAQLSERTDRFMEGEEEPPDKQGLN
jgi:hypothetical protein